MTRAMKPSGIEWIGDIPEGWEIRKLKYEVNFQEGPGIMAYDFKDDGVPLLRLINVQNTKVNLLDCNFLDPIKVEKKWKHFKCKINDLLISGSASNGIVCKVDEIAEGAIPYTGLFRIWSTSSVIFAEYVKWFLKSDLFDTQILLYQTGTTIHHFGPEHLRKMKLTLPPLPEQQVIADYLDRKSELIDNTIEKQNTVIEKLKLYKQSIITEAVTKGLDTTVTMKPSGIEWIGEIPEDWEVCRIKDLSPVKRGASPRPIDDRKYFDEQGVYKWVRISDVTASEMYLNDAGENLSELGTSLSVKLEPDNLFISICASVGKPCITSIKCCIHDGFVYFPKLKKMYNKWLFHIFYCGTCYGGLGKMGTQLNLNTDTVGNISIPVPSDIEIDKILNYLDQKCTQIDQIIEQKQTLIEKLANYKKSLIYECVTGKREVEQNA
jgi:type I restriction enzyme S subunit